ncbi:IPT/TIG domain-containing protein [Streptomyces sp. Ncost-T10-10d]|uniref:IPT/TIG domain-containing protein n=1 Tax=Streptomyces sp. Ncost-T10-10d TaxID=1839774 RepID=UPI00081E78EC|nr:IPT/TIG domain-containing protein [Streptomyces sp. Ncost-T10-10d]SCF67056.1 IPT/TIG domain-containing protein [Streptomyces sp. Ncost-T10-10d]
MSTNATSTDQSQSAAQLPFPFGPLLLAVLPNSGPVVGGNTVQLLGVGLSGATSVLFGTTPATIVSQDMLGLTVTIVVPANAAGTVPVTVTTGGGTSNSVFYTYVNPSTPAPPTATSITPASGPVAGGTPFVIAGTNLNGGTVNVNGVPATVLVSDPTGILLFGIIPAGTAAGNVPVVVTTAAGTATVPGGYTYI